MCIVVPGPSVIPLVIDGLLKKRPYCSKVSKATVSLTIVKLGSLSDCVSCAVNVIVWFTLTPDISTVEGWIPGPKVTIY